MNGAKLAATLPSLVLALFAAAYVGLSYRYGFASRTLPWMAGMLALVLALVDAVSRARDATARKVDTGRPTHARRASDRRASAGPRSAAAQELLAFAWIGVFLPLVVVLGFYAAILLYVFCYLRVYAGKSGVAAAGTAFAVSGFLYVVFEILMGYEIFGGLLGGGVV